MTTWKDITSYINVLFITLLDKIAYNTMQEIPHFVTNKFRKEFTIYKHLKVTLKFLGTVWLYLPDHIVLMSSAYDFAISPPIPRGLLSFTSLIHLSLNRYSVSLGTLLIHYKTHSNSFFKWLPTHMKQK